MTTSNKMNIDVLDYKNLPSGTYTLEIAAKAPNTEWAPALSIATFTIKKPFYATVWFISLAVLTAILAVAALERARITLFERRRLRSLVERQTSSLKNALDEKEVLIKEIHHRVKNNLAIISGLLDLQSWKMEEGEARAALQNSKMRIFAMAKIHERLYQNEDLARVNFRLFTEDLVQSLEHSMDAEQQNIHIHVEVEDIFMDVNIGVPLGLLVNEIISNCFKHAFPDSPDTENAIHVKFSKKKKYYLLAISDNGKGTEGDILETEHNSLGITLIKSLASQLDAKLSFSGEGGAHYNVQIPVQN